MGAGQSTNNVVGRGYYVWWGLPQVASAFERARARRKGDEALVWLDRKGFWEVFTDYSVIQHGTFLSLPLTLFDVFKTPDDLVNAHEVLLVLALFGSGDKEQQLELCFRMFDVDDSGNISKDEMLQFMTILCTASAKIGLLDKVPRKEILIQVTEDMFKLADVDGDETIECSEFVPWCTSHVLSQRLLSAFRKAGRSTALGKTHKQAKTVGSSATSTAAVENRLRELTAIQVIRNSAVSKLSSAKNQFGINSLRNLQTAFRIMVGTTGALTVLQFEQVLREQYPGLSVSSVRALFDSFDEDRSGDVDLKEFTVGLAKCIVGTLEEKLGLLFSVLDKSGDGTTTVADLLEVIRVEGVKAAELTQLTEELIAGIRADADGNISISDFKSAVLTNPVLYECFQRCNVPRLVAIKPAFQAYARRRQYDVEYLTKVLDKYSSRDHAIDSFSRERFTRFMMDEFGITRGNMALAHRVFRAIDQDNTLVIGKIELFNGLVQLVDGSKEAKAEFFFKLFDSDNKGHMDRDELLHMIMNSQETLDTNSGVAVDVLKSLETDGGGRISLNDFRTAARRHPQLLDCFANIFGTSDMVLSTPGGKVGALSRLLLGAEPSTSSSATVLPPALSPPSSPDATFTSPRRMEPGPPRTVTAEIIASQKAVNSLRRASLTTAGNVVTQAYQILKRTESNTGMVSSKAPRVALAAKAFGSMVTDALAAELDAVKMDMKRHAKAQHDRLYAEADGKTPGGTRSTRAATLDAASLVSLAQDVLPRKTDAPAATGRPSTAGPTAARKPSFVAPKPKVSAPVSAASTASLGTGTLVSDVSLLSSASPVPASTGTAGTRRIARIRSANPALGRTLSTSKSMLPSPTTPILVTTSSTATLQPTISHPDLRQSRMVNAQLKLMQASVSGLSTVPPGWQDSLLSSDAKSPGPGPVPWQRRPKSSGGAATSTCSTTIPKPSFLRPTAAGAGQLPTSKTYQPLRDKTPALLSQWFQVPAEKPEAEMIRDILLQREQQDQQEQ